MTELQLQRRDKMVHDLSRGAATVKLVCGIGNNAAWLTVLEAHDHAKQCKRYRQYSVRHEFKQALKMFHEYERRLIYATEMRMFHLADMSPEYRKKYGNISDREYYEFWTASGGQAYINTRPLLTSLWNKYRLSLVSHGVSDAEHVAWVMTAQATLELAVSLYNGATEDVVHAYNIPANIVNKVFRQFSLEPLAKKWRSALKALSPDSEGYELDSVEEKNIIHGIEQLHEAWTDPSIFYDSTAEAAESYEEVFRTKGEMKKTMRELMELKEETLNELAQ